MSAAFFGPALSVQNFLARGDAEEAAFIVMNEVLGGGFSSRINLKLREEKQWTYGAFSYADRRLGKGPMVVATDVQTPNTADAVAELLAQLDLMVQSGVTDAELTFAKESWVKSLPGLFGLPPVQVTAAAQLFAYSLPESYYADLVTKVNAVTLDDAKKVAVRALKKEDLVVVLVGDKATLEPKLKEKALGDAAAFNKDGTPAK
jgi:zinc protease